MLIVTISVDCRLIEVLRRDHVLVFTDGSVYSPGSAGSVGCGACAAVLFPASRENCGLQIKKGSGHKG